MVGYAAFGSTGHQSCRVIFGAAALSRVDQGVADEVLSVLLSHGVNHIDTAAGYGEAEVRIAPWMATHRDHFFLATKTSERSGDGARSSLERSLTRMGVDAVDLIQLHNLVEEEEWTTALGRGGALESLIKAREEGLVRFIGVTGHGTRIPRMHKRSLERFPFDAVLFPYNFTMMTNDRYRSDVGELLALCAERGVAVQTIKGIARRRWPEGSRPEDQARRSWYEPLEDVGAIDRAVRYVLANEQLFLNSSSDYRLLSKILDAAAGDAVPPSDAELLQDSERFDATALFDGAQLERI